jgi:hypothetical protein
MTNFSRLSSANVRFNIETFNTRPAAAFPLAPKDEAAIEANKIKIGNTKKMIEMLEKLKPIMEKPNNEIARKQAAEVIVEYYDFSEDKAENKKEADKLKAVGISPSQFEELRKIIRGDGIQQRKSYVGNLMTYYRNAGGSPAVLNAYLKRAPKLTKLIDFLGY